MPSVQIYMHSIALCIRYIESLDGSIPFIAEYIICV